MKDRIMKNWDMWRIVKAVLAVVFIVAGIIRLDYFLLAGGGYLVFNVVFNTCESCATNECEIPKNKTQ